MIWITDAEYIKDYMLLIRFNDGVKKTVDLRNELDEGIFMSLKDKEYFKKFHISANTVEWENGADFAPEFLRSLAEYDSQIPNHQLQPISTAELVVRFSSKQKMSVM